MKKKFNILFFTFFMVFLLSCEHKSKNCHSNINVVNKSNATIFVNFSRSYPDTTLIKFTDPNPILDQSNKALANDSMGLFSRGCWEDQFTDPRLIKEKIIIFLFDEKRLKETNWDSIKVKNLYLKRYDLTLEDLQNSNWTITYP